MLRFSNFFFHFLFKNITKYNFFAFTKAIYGLLRTTLITYYFTLVRKKLKSFYEFFMSFLKKFIKILRPLFIADISYFFFYDILLFKL